MNKSLPALFLTFALATLAHAENTVKLSNVHLCCKGCITGVEKAVKKADGVTMTADPDDETVTLTSPDLAAAQKAVDAMVAAGFYAKSSEPAVQPHDISGAKDEKVTTLTVSGVHLCCGKCVKAVNAALGEVKGVTGNTAEKGVKSFEVKGDFNSKEVFASLEKAGFSGKAGN
jgi:copper chaperone CopZ